MITSLGIFSLPTSGRSNSSSEEIDDRDDNDRGYYYEVGEEEYIEEIEEFDLGTNGVTEKNPHLQPGSIFTFADNSTTVDWGYFSNEKSNMHMWKDMFKIFADDNRLWLDPWDWLVVDTYHEYSMQNVNGRMMLTCTTFLPSQWFEEHKSPFKKWYMKNRKYQP